MAQTKRKRSTKHRGNAAGVVEARGRTGRKPTAAERKEAAKGAKGTTARANRFDKPPTWSGSAKRAVIMTVIFVGVILAMKRPIAAVGALAAFMLIVYIPLGYYTDLWLYRRRQRMKAQGKIRS